MESKNSANQRAKGEAHENEAFEDDPNGLFSLDSSREYEDKETTIEFSSIDNNDEGTISAGNDAKDLSSSQLERNLALGMRSSQQLTISDHDEKMVEPTINDSPQGSLSHNEQHQFTINWENLDYVRESKWYKLTNQRKPILNGLRGAFKSGELSAVLGPSGSGKSTLIDCLMGKRTRGLTGKTKVTFTDLDREQERRKRKPLRIAIIPQEDHLLDSLTVTETFMFASKIKNAHLVYDEVDADKNDKMTNIRDEGEKRPFDHFGNVQRVIQQLNLSSCASSKCGKLSGGQYKRVSIGQELLSRPDLLILDEPTSGLDSVTCFQTISALRQLIDSSPYPMAIVATIHQPDIEVFNLFHKVYVLASGGKAIYEGPTNMIFKTIKLGVEMLRARKKQTVWEFSSGGSSEVDSSSLTNLSLQLKEQSQCNPARLIVEVAANGYGFEIINALNEIQLRGYADHSDSPYNSSEITITTMTNPSISTKNSTNISQSLMVVSSEKLAPNFDYTINDPAKRKCNLDKLLCLASANMNQRRSIRVYLKHLLYHTHRSWITIVRDPMLFSLQVLLHVMVPLLISYSFQGHMGDTDACPKIGTLDVVDEAFRSGNVLEDLNTELRLTFENLGYMFFQIYVIIFAAVCVTSLTYPLAMHVLLKEYRNGWYSMSSYFLGRTIADLPVPTFNVFIAMAISYHLTGQPLSPYGWRFLSVALLTVLATLVAQTQGLMFGAMLMNAPQSAVFVAPASTAPLVVVCGFLLRIQSLPIPLKFLSQFSYFTYLLNGFIVSRYGFNRCPCNEDDFTTYESHQIPQQARGIINLWVESFSQEYPETNSTSINLIDELVDTITKAKKFGYEITECSQLRPFTMLDFQLNDSDLKLCFAALMIMLVVFRWLTYIVLSWKIGSSI